MTGVVNKFIATSCPMYVLTVADGDEDIGSLTLYIIADRVALIDHMQIKEERRRQGYGRMLVAEAETIAKSHGCESVFACARKDSHYSQLYFGRLGFEFSGHQLCKTLS